MSCLLEATTVQWYLQPHMILGLNISSSINIIKWKLQQKNKNNKAARTSDDYIKGIPENDNYEM